MTTQTRKFFPVFTAYLKEIKKSILISTTYIQMASLLCVFNQLTQPIFSSEQVWAFEIHSEVFSEVLEKETLICIIKYFKEAFSEI